MSASDRHGRADLSPVKRALLEVRELRARLEAAERGRGEPVAIVGMGCRFPGGANDPEALWRLLLEGRDVIRDVPPDRWDAAAYYDPDPATPGKMSTRWGGFIDGVDRFDAEFFGVSPREAAGMDPQHRLVLEVAWEALEHAGQAPDRLAGSPTGVFVGISSQDYGQLVLDRDETAVDSHLAQGIVHSAASGRLAYLLGLRGPALSLDTACSSSLVAVHLAVQSIRRGECTMALAGGVNVILLPDFLIAFSKAGMMAADGRCKPFDARADGFVRAEGCGIVVLKRLADAVADGDTVWAVIRGSAVNQDGRSSGMTAPNGPAQEAVIRAALADAGTRPAEVAFVETHGTGTALGDPIEIQALAAALGEGRGGTRFHIGSIKANLGHLEAAAGVAGLMKAALVLAHQEIPPHLHFTAANPHIAWAEIPADVPRDRVPLPARDGRRVAGVSSFGFTGTNAHVVLEAPPAPPHETNGARPGERALHVLKLSARGEPALRELALRMARHLAQSRSGFADICFTAAVGRADLPDRLAVVAGTATDAREKLAAFARAEDVADLCHGRAVDAARMRVTFLFTGHGCQYVNMGRRLFETEPTFRAALERCDALLRPHLERPLLSVLYPGGDETESPLATGMTYSQPALFALEYALAELWRSWGVTPAAVLGHSVGEYVAACVAGVMSVEDGLKLVAARGRLMDAVSESGAMLAIFAPEADVRALVAPFAAEVSIAALNGPTEVVISGARSAIDAIAGDVAARTIDFRRLDVAQAAHSHLLEPILDEFERVAVTIRFAHPQVDLISCTSGRSVTPEELADARYWRRHLREPVRFADAVRTLAREGYETFVEIGPDPRLSAMGRRCLPDDYGLWVPSLRREWDDRRQMLEGLAALYVRGVPIDWAGFEGHGRERARSPRRRVALPTYPWQHERHWVETPPRSARGSWATRLEPWDAAVAAGHRAEESAPLDLSVPTIRSRWRCLDRLTTAIAADILGRMGAFAEPATPESAEAMLSRLGVLPAYRGLLARWLRRLADAGWVERDGDRYQAARPGRAPDLAEAWRAADESVGDWPFLLDYLRHCAELMPAVLTGAESPLETMFPGGSFETADQLYRHWALPRYFNRIMRAVLEPVVEIRPLSRPLRVLEIGAGTGGTTAALLPALPRGRTSYTFTDVAPHFLTRAAERFADYDFLRFGLLDINRHPREQGYTLGGYDVIVAANVLHATRDLHQTVRHARSLLAPGGLLVAFEVTEYLAWFDVTTALLEGWEDHADELRPDHPLLTPTQWEHVLRAEGFESVAAFPRAGSMAEALGQHVLLARAPGAADGVAGDAVAPEAGRVIAAARAEPEAGGARGETGEVFRERLAAMLPQERDEELAAFVRRSIAALLRLPPDRVVDRRRRLMELGLDSLMAVELRSRLSTGLALAQPLPATLIFDHPTVDAIVVLLARTLDPAGGAASPNGAGTAPPSASSGCDRPPAVTEADLDAWTEEEVKARLLARLESLEGRT